MIGEATRNRGLEESCKSLIVSTLMEEIESEKKKIKQALIARGYICIHINLSLNQYLSACYSSTYLPGKGLLSLSLERVQQRVTDVVDVWCESVMSAFRVTDYYSPVKISCP